MIVLREWQRPLLIEALDALEAQVKLQRTPDPHRAEEFVAWRTLSQEVLSDIRLTRARLVGR